MTIDDGLEIERTTKLTMEDSFSMEEERAGSTMAVARKRGGFFFSPLSERERERVINKLN